MAFVNSNRPEITQDIFMEVDNDFVDGGGGGGGGSSFTSSSSLTASQNNNNSSSNQVTNNSQPPIVLNSGGGTISQDKPTVGILLTTNNDLNNNLDSQIPNPVNRVNNSMYISKSSEDLRETMNLSFDKIKNINIDQQKQLIHSISINSPIIMSNHNMSIIYQDIYGNEYNYPFYKDGTYFGLTAKVAHSLSDDIVYAPVNNNYNIFKLYQEIKPSTYFVYAFTDITTNEISYKRYLGDINYVNDIPMGTNIPKLENAKVIERVDPESIIINSYSSYVIQDTSYCILEEVFLPKIVFSIDNDGKVTNDYEDEFDIEFKDKKETTYFIRNELVKLESENKDEEKAKFSPKHLEFNFYKTNDNNIINDLYTTLDILIKNYSLYSGINVLKKLENTITLNPITLYIPKKIYTDATTKDYVPYLLKHENSNYHISTSKTGNNIKFEIYDNNSESNSAIKTFTHNENTSKIYINGNNFYSFEIDNNINVLYSFSKIKQDEDFNNIEVFIEEIDINDLEDIIINFIIQDKEANEVYNNKIKLSDSIQSNYLYSYESVIINEPTLEFAYMTYMDYISNMSSIGKIEYVVDFSYKYYNSVSSETNIKYISDVLYERTGLEASYTYWAPEIKSYAPYYDSVLEFNGNFYGSNIFQSNYFDSIEDSSNYDNDKIDNDEYFTYSVQLIELVKRNKLNNIDNTGKSLHTQNVKDNGSLIKLNEEINYGTYLNTPFELKNQTYLSFYDEYEFIQPKYGYIVSSVDAIIKSDIINEYETDLAKNAEFNQNIKFNAKESKADNTAYTIYLFNCSSYDVYKLDESFTYIDIDTSSLDLINVGIETISKTDAIWGSDKNTQKNTVINIEEYLESSCTLSYSIDSYSYFGIDTLQNFFTFNKDEIFNILNEESEDNHKTDLFKTSKPIIITTSEYLIELNNPSLVIYNEPTNSHLNDTKEKYKHLNIIETSNYDNNTLKYENGYCILSNTITLSYEELGSSYSYSEVIFNDGYWKRNYKEEIKPFINISYTYSSNSLDISNAYIVPSTKNERLGFIKQNKITYNDFINSYTEKIVYTYIDSQNVQRLFDETVPGSLIIEEGDKYFGIQKKENNVIQNLFSITQNNFVKIYIDGEWEFVECKKDNIDINSNGFKEVLEQEDYETLKNTDIKYDKEHFEVIEINDTDNVKDENNKKGLLKIIPDKDTKNYLLQFGDKIINVYKTKLRSSYINSLVELHRRLTVSQDRKLKEFTIQEEELISQYAQIDTPFGITNSKKVIVTDAQYVPTTYVTVSTIDPNTYEYLTYEVVSTYAHYTYTYEVEDVPLKTAAYVYNDEDGFKIRGMDELIEAISNNIGSFNLPSFAYETLENGGTIVSYSNNSQWLKKIHGTLLSYMSAIDDSLSYISKLQSSINKIPDSIDKISYNNNIVSYLVKNNDKIILSDLHNTNNLISAQKSMINKLTTSIDKQTTTLSKLMISSGNISNSEIVDNIFNDFSPQNWSTISMIGYTYTYVSQVNSNRPISYKATKIISREKYASAYVTRTGTYNLEEPKSIYYSYTDFMDPNMSSFEKIGLRLNKETKDFSYNGYIYRQDIYSYQNLADVLADLHISNRLPTRKEFIVDVSKRLYINSDFIFAYTSPNEYAIRAIYRADVLWNELIKAGIIEDTKMKVKDIPEEILKNKESKNKWWKDRLTLNKFAYALDLDVNLLRELNEENFVEIERDLKSNQSSITDLITRPTQVKPQIKPNVLKDKIQQVLPPTKQVGPPQQVLPQTPPKQQQTTIQVKPYF